MKAVSYLSVVWVLVALAGASAVAQQSQSTYLRWAASSDAAANPSLTYNVYRASSCSGTFTKINSAPVTATTYLDNQPPPGSYCYRVTAVLNGVESNPSNAATATILPLKTQPATNSSSASEYKSPASAKQPCSHAGDLVNWIRCVAEKARAKITPPLPVH
jgi:hypothetical protein